MASIKYYIKDVLTIRQDAGWSFNLRELYFVNVRKVLLSHAASDIRAYSSMPQAENPADSFLFCN